MNIQSINHYIEEVSRNFSEIRDLNRRQIKRLNRTLESLQQLCSSLDSNEENDSRQFDKIFNRIEKLNTYLMEIAPDTNMDHYREILSSDIDSVAQSCIPADLSTPRSEAKAQHPQTDIHYHDNSVASVTVSNKNVGQVLKDNLYRQLVLGTVESPVGRFLLSRIQEESRGKSFLIYGTKYGQRLLLQTKLSMHNHVYNEDTANLAARVWSDFNCDAFKSIEKTDYPQVSNYWLNGYNDQVNQLLRVKKSKNVSGLEEEKTGGASLVASNSSSDGVAVTRGKVPICTTELRYLFREWDRFQSSVKFTNIKSDTADQMVFVNPPWQDCNRKAKQSWACYALHLVDKFLDSDQSLKRKSNIQQANKEMISLFQRGNYEGVISIFHDRVSPGRLRGEAGMGMASSYLGHQASMSSSRKGGAAEVKSNGSGRKKRKKSKRKGKYSKRSATVSCDIQVSEDQGANFRRRFFSNLNKTFTQDNTNLLKQLVRPGCVRKLQVDLSNPKKKFQAAERYIIARMCKALLEESLELDIPVLYTLQGINIEAVAGANPMTVEEVEGIVRPVRHFSSCVSSSGRIRFSLERPRATDEEKRMQQTVESAGTAPPLDDSLLPHVQAIASC